MLRSLNTGISGLRAHQNMLDVTGNNIANVNTTGFKSSRTQFQDTLSQLVAAGVAPDQQVGGANPAQIGLGVTTAAITTQFTQGASQPTGVPTDLMIDGDGFFVVESGGQQLYTRNGAFDFDANGRMVSADGAFVRGWTAVGGVVNTSGPLGRLTIPVGDVAPPEATTRIALGGNLPADAKDGTKVVRDIEIFDELGTSTKMSLEFSATGGKWSVSALDTATGTVVEGPQALTFTDGALTGGGSLTVAGVAIDLGTVTSYAGLSNIAVSAKDGAAAGALTSYSVSGNGSIVGTYSNGKTAVLGQVALATFTNMGGLEKAGGSTYAATQYSGDVLVGGAGDQGMGSIQAGYLEMSNVDLSQEFTNLIVSQRGFQANSRVITTSDEVLTELVNLKR
ncbi:flagellar hook protein FlgE [Oerskovia jenensis]|uniref:Flagellar hook protein FlgE n=1 Tax=Oerskovia jenensis TaxID=162169 RepID=A0ABS2LDG5_9CELL|nr:flagellar hook protein FlgE [Oerskovia jenensis]MBM7478464.1 flagellar hook protein FlgE [Oerskovia jenensis]